MKHSVLFVCTANQCRSPLAEVTFRQFVQEMGEKNEDWRVSSAGVYAIPNHPASFNARQAAAEHGLDLSNHRAQPTSQNLVESFALILTMEKLHRQELQQMNPASAHKIFMLSELSGSEQDVQDPVGLSLEEYVKTIVDLQKYYKYGWKNIFQLSREP